GAGEERPLHVALALPGPFFDLRRLHVELLGAPQGEAPVLFTGDVGLIAQLLTKPRREDETTFCVERVLVLPQEGSASSVHHFTTTNPSMARQTPPCCAISRHPTPQPSTRQPSWCTRRCGHGPGPSPAHPCGRGGRAGRCLAVPPRRRRGGIGHRRPRGAGPRRRA